ncbi:MAG: ATP-grasp fold amidoligase family protein [Gallionellaceae bacterium]|nr:ATP-grasp fold amidoligase family protein [Gallionellaceae bacterium]MDD5365899.1 ATP-grasp fold amidoligase family protein [Gallionellaceae bacterium]
MTDKPFFWTLRTYSQKVAWRCRNPDRRVDYRTWADKHLAKAIARPHFKVAESYLVVTHPDEIDIARLPATFVMKATHGWDMSLLVRDGVVQGGNRSLTGAGRSADTAFLRQLAQTWLDSKKEARRRARERHYGRVDPGIVFEQLIEPIDHELQLFLFSGEFRFALVGYRGFHHSGATHRVYDQHWLRLPPGSEEAATRYEREAPETPRPPADLLEALGRLCRHIDHVRVDFFVCDQQYYFGEFTFTHNAGKPGFIGRYDAALGRFWLD